MGIDMTDEPDKTGKPKKGGEMRTGVKTLLTILVALAFLVGCKSKPPKAGYLYFNDVSVMFVELAQTGHKIEGTMEESGRNAYGKVGSFKFMFYGVSDGENVSMFLYPSETAQDDIPALGQTITGTLSSNTLTLVPSPGREHVLCRRATAAEYDEAIRNLRMRIELNKGAY